MTIKKSQDFDQEPDYKKTSIIFGPEEDRIELLFLDKIKYRRCTVYLVIQYSFATGNVRILAYGTDLILHHAVCFGTSLDLVSSNELNEHINTELTKKLNKGCLSINSHARDKLMNGNYTRFLLSI